MPLGTRRITFDELKWLQRLGRTPLVVGTDTWRIRRDLNLAITSDESPITLQQAKTLRALVGKVLRKKFPVTAPAFAASPEGPFPYTKRERA